MLVSRPVTLLIFLFAASGCAALIYEIVWLQLLQLAIGSAAVSVGLLLAAYMGGLSLGSAALPRIISPERHHPFRVYAALEIGIAAFGILELFLIPFVSRLYIAGASYGMIEFLLRGAVAAICLLPPTLLMGASLPAIARWFENSRDGAARMGYLYSANTAGAVLGCLLAGFYLLRVYDVAVAAYAAVAMNMAVAAVSFLAARGREARGYEQDKREDTPASAGFTPTLIYIAIALSGMCALGAEVVWTRLLSLLLGGTVYTFSIILAVFLLGLWAGSAIGASLARRAQDPRESLARFLILMAAGIAWTGYTLSQSLPYWPVDPWLSIDPWFNFELDFVRTVWAIFPATVLFGACFPMALAAAVSPGEDSGKLSGGIYAANTAGSIAGALVFSMLFIPMVGTRASQQLLIGIAVTAAVLAAASTRRPGGAIIVALVLGAALTRVVADVPWEIVAYGHRVAPTLRAFDLYNRGNATKVLYKKEGINSSVLIAERDGQRQFHVNGKTEASTSPLDMRLQRMMGHVPALIHAGPRSVLTIGFGAGVTAGSFVPYPGIEKMTVCELEPMVPPGSTEFFGAQNYRVLDDPRTRMVYDDARHYIFTTREKFDIIASDPLDPWVKGTAALYTREFLETAKRRLNRGGVLSLFVQLYEGNEQAAKTELATFFDVFPNGTLWSNNVNQDGYDLVLLGRLDEGPIDVDHMQERLDRPEYARVLQSISDVGFHSAVEVVATYAGRASDLRPWLAGAEINEDRNLRLQYLAGLAVNSIAYKKIYQGILSYRRFPEGLFAASPGRLEALRTLLRPSR